MRLQEEVPISFVANVSPHIMPHLPFPDCTPLQPSLQWVSPPGVVTAAAVTTTSPPHHLFHLHLASSSAQPSSPPQPQLPLPQATSQLLPAFHAQKVVHAVAATGRTMQERVVQLEALEVYNSLSFAQAAITTASSFTKSPPLGVTQPSSFERFLSSADTSSVDAKHLPSFASTPWEDGERHVPRADSDRSPCLSLPRCSSPLSLPSQFPTLTSSLHWSAPSSPSQLPAPFSPLPATPDSVYPMQNTPPTAPCQHSNGSLGRPTAVRQRISPHPKSTPRYTCGRCTLPLRVKKAVCSAKCDGGCDQPIEVI